METLECDFELWKGYASTGAHRPYLERSAPERSVLSTAHISPQICYYDGASLFKVSKGGQCDAIAGGKRGRIHGFSQASRLRLMRVIAKVKRDADLPLFVTLTYPDEFPSPEESKIHLDNFIRRLQRRCPKMGMIWKLEPQMRGAPHYHCMVWGVSFILLSSYVPQMWFEIAGGGDPNHLAWHEGRLGHGNQHCVQRVRSFRGVWSYASKYLGKTFDVARWDKKWTGRFWGVINPQNIPFGELRELVITRRLAVQIMRYERRFTRTPQASKKKKYHISGDRRSLIIFCDASQWAERLCPIND